jgi:hypothetical protein
MRADRGGHSASNSVLRGIYESSIANLCRAIGEIDDSFGTAPAVTLEAEKVRLSTALSKSQRRLPGCSHSRFRSSQAACQLGRTRLAAQRVDLPFDLGEAPG